MLVSFQIEHYSSPFKKAGIALLSLFCFFPLYGKETSCRPNKSSQPVLKNLKRKKQNQVLRKFIKVHKEFSKKVCPAGTDHKFEKLSYDYRGEGHYLPFNKDETLDKETIRKYLPLIEEKERWISQSIKELKATFPNKNIFNKLNEIESTLKEILSLKERKDFKRNWTAKDQEILNKKHSFLRRKFNHFLEEIPSFLSFKFPVDHFSLRQMFDEKKIKKDPLSNQMAREVYFYRKIVQDGASNPNRSQNDLSFRMALDTIYLGLNKPFTGLPEDLRYDLSYFFKRMRKYLMWGEKKWKGRLKEWRKRTQKTLSFYRKVLTKEFNSIALKKSKAKYKLKRFVHDKFIETYLFWKKQPEEMRALYVMDTILYNEVGNLDGRDGLERNEVAGVVLNRYFEEKYSKLSFEDDFFKSLNSKKGLLPGVINHHKWLNLLFKTGEFSFTFYFIPGSLKVFCPSQTKLSRKLRKENLRIGLSHLIGPKSPTKAIRYYSRAGMLGRIRMDKIWDEYTPLKEIPGPRLASSNLLLKEHYKKGMYEYYYSFKDFSGKKFKVLNIKGKTYAMNFRDKTLHKYRDPHYFRYFRKRKNSSSFTSEKNCF